MNFFSSSSLVLSNETKEERNGTFTLVLPPAGLKLQKTLPSYPLLSPYSCAVSTKIPGEKVNCCIFFLLPRND